MNDAEAAARYRWLREQMGLGNAGKADVYIRYEDDGWDDAPQIMSPDHLDAAINIAMKAEGK